MQKVLKLFHCKIILESFSLIDGWLISHSEMCCGLLLESPRLYVSHGHSQHNLADEFLIYHFCIWWSILICLSLFDMHFMQMIKYALYVILLTVSGKPCFHLRTFCCSQKSINDHRITDFLHVICACH